MELINDQLSRRLHQTKAWAEVVSPGHHDYETAEGLAQIVIDRDGTEEARLAALALRVMQSREHTAYWYGIRFDRLRELLKDDHPDLWRKAACVIANGSASIDEPPTLAQQANAIRHRMEAERERRIKLHNALSTLRDHFALCVDDPEFASASTAQADEILAAVERDIAAWRADRAEA